MNRSGRTTGSQRMRDLIAQLPEQLSASADLPGLADATPPPAPPERVVLCGMGGSAIAGDLLGPVMARVQLDVWRDYGLPSWAGPDDLVLAMSYSGNTEETLSAWEEGGRRGCPRIALTSGGVLAEGAARAGVTAIRLPAGLPPRAALGHGVGALVRLLERLGLGVGGDEAIAEAVAELRRLGEQRLAVDDHQDDGSGNPHPRRVAEDLKRSVAVVHTAGAEAHAAGGRLRAQLNENAKVPALLASYPELDHNEVEAWDPAGDRAGEFCLIRLREAVLAPELEKRLEMTGDLVDGAFAACHTVSGSGAGPLARIMSLVQWGDALSWHLADLRGIDPVPVDRIEQLKRALAAGPGD